jgi:hypothetical protein
MRSIHAALANDTCIVGDLIATEDLAAARMTVQAHSARFFEVDPTGREISWEGVHSSRPTAISSSSFGCLATSKV